MAFLHPSSIIETRSSQAPFGRPYSSLYVVFCKTTTEEWIEWIPWAEFSYNTSTHSSTKFSSFETVYGVPSPSFLSYIPGTTRVMAVDEYLQDRDAILKELRHNLWMAQDIMKSHTNQRDEIFSSMLETSFM
ncbi:hypothetical protein CK203_063272 [Vitis vinifera]|uniref:Integrase catalytic domain-containing protein n=1 Tax=Vitis vinifera TaxID=29760 RepID=A0A438FT79_VITVI|nr:hypothetical protein CK203_063272 [Vitis vinifera]